MPQGKMDKRTIESIVQSAVKDAIDFVDEEISEDRTKAQRYFDGKVDIGEEDGRSSVVSTKVRDTIRAIKPSLMRVFLSSDKPVEYIPESQEQVAMSEQATRYVQWRFDELGGYRILNDAFHDALLKKVGIVKAFWETHEESEIHEFSNLTEDEYYLLAADDDVEILEYSEEEILSDDPLVPSEVLRSMKVSHKKTSGRLCVTPVPPEEFFIDRNARSLDDFYVCGHKTDMRGGDLVEMGIDYETVSSLSGVHSDDTQAQREDAARRGYEPDTSDQSEQDVSMKLVAVSEAFMKMDVEGTGIPQMYKFILGGTDNKLLDYEPWGDVSFAAFEVDPEPHTFYGRSLADLIMEDQDASTAMLRGILDNVALTNNPRTEAVDSQVNMGDLMNNEIGGVVRVRSPGMIRDLSVPFVAGQTLSAVQYMDEQVETKTGVTRASMGLNADALQSSTKSAVDATVQGANGQMEVIARNLAEGGMRRLFKLMLKLVVENSDEEQMMRLNSQFVPIDPRSWDTSMDVSVNVGLGTGQDEQRNMALNQTLQLQLQIMQQYGPDNGLVTLTGIRNTVADVQSLGGIKNTDRYFEPMNPQIEQQLMQQAAQKAAQQQQGGDPNAAFLQAEQIKAQQRMQSDQMKVQQKSESEAMRMRMDAQQAINQDDLERDRMAQDLYIEQARIASDSGTKVNIERIKAEQAATRPQPQQVM
jgi:hypothetical protein